jgi:uncharacterized membrane protein
VHIEQLFEAISGAVALGLELIAVLVIAGGGLQALGGILSRTLARQSNVIRRKEIWLSFGTWLLLGLEFELAADIVRTAIAPSWTDLGWLGSVAVIRTFLSFFLERDLEKERARNAI